MCLAYQGHESMLSRHIAGDFFLIALADSETEIKKREQEPVNLQAAYQFMVRFETHKFGTIWNRQQLTTCRQRMCIVYNDMNNPGGWREEKKEREKKMKFFDELQSTRGYASTPDKGLTTAAGTPMQDETDWESYIDMKIDERIYACLIDAGSKVSYIVGRGEKL